MITPYTPRQKTLDQMKEKYGRLTVIRLLGRDENRSRIVETLCDCGTTKLHVFSSLIRGDTRSCGCLNRETVRQRRYKHGVGTKKTKVYYIWVGIKQRCFNQKNQDYKGYGGRGITLFEEWKNDFVAFRDYMGDRPEGTSIDRIDNDGNYEPGNVRWATATQQANNTRKQKRAQKISPN